MLTSKSLKFMRDYNEFAIIIIKMLSNLSQSLLCRQDQNIFKRDTMQTNICFVGRFAYFLKQHYANSKIVPRFTLDRPRLPLANVLCIGNDHLIFTYFSAAKRVVVLIMIRDSRITIQKISNNCSALYLLRLFIQLSLQEYQCYRFFNNRYYHVTQK